MSLALVPAPGVTTTSDVTVNDLRLYADDTGRCPDIDSTEYDILLTTAINAPAPWVSVTNISSAAQTLRQRYQRMPLASSTAMELLRTQAPLTFEHALVAESLCYSTLLGGQEFRHWLAHNRHQRTQPQPTEWVRYEREGQHVTLTLNDPNGHNALNTLMRDELVHALDTCLLDPTLPNIRLQAAGRSFSIGGALEDFGKTTDLALAHRIRLQQSVTARVHQLRSQLTVELRGAVVGAGLELAAAAGWIEAHDNTWMQLPELSMGLIPGAGGTVSIARRIGRHRCAYLLLSGRKISTRTALHWGLIDHIIHKDN